MVKYRIKFSWERCKQHREANTKKAEANNVLKLVFSSFRCCKFINISSKLIDFVKLFSMVINTEITDVIVGQG